MADISGAEVVTRFAPSPTGYLHLGHVYAAHQAWQIARCRGGRFLLRIEDIDPTRCREEFTAAILEDLAWLGLDWHGPVRRQSQHFEDYGRALDRLEALGVLYPCFCTRREIAAEIRRAGGAPQGETGPPYPGSCRRLGPNERIARRRAAGDYALRLDCAEAAALVGPLDWIEEDDHGSRRVAAEPAKLGDVVLARKEMPASYHLAVTLDDALQGVSLVTGGEDLFAATHLHRLLQALLDLPTPNYWHHPLLTDAAGRRLAKRDRALTIRSLRSAGLSPAEVLARAQSSGR